MTFYVFLSCCTRFSRTVGLITTLTRVASVYNGPKGMELHVPPNPRYIYIGVTMRGSAMYLPPPPPSHIHSCKW